MLKKFQLAALALICSLALLASCGGAGTTAPATAPPAAIVGEGWWGFGRDVQHSSIGGATTQPLASLRWQAPVDVAPQYSGTSLLIHYGTPVISAANTVLVPVKTGATGGFRIDARAGPSGALLWSATTDYILPAQQNWVPSYNLSLTPGGRVYAPGAGGKLFFRDAVDSATGTLQTVVFYGADIYNASRAAFDAGVTINTPLTIDSRGNIFFGFIANGTNPANLTSGVARVGADGRGTWVSASVAASDAAILKVATNSAPALSADLATLYVAVNTSNAGGSLPSGYLLALDATTLATRARARLTDPARNAPAWVSDDATSSPTVGPDGDVYFGVLEAAPPSHNYTGWMLHFDATLGQKKTPGAFGWDTTASIIPASMVPAYTGPSRYLLMTKFNSYGGVGTGNGRHRLAILDPNQTQTDAFSTASVMKEVQSILGVTPDPGYPGGVMEWCINTAAVDVAGKSVLANSEDGILYRWDLPSNRFSEQIRLNSGYAQAYTPTAIGPDGAVYSVNNATLFAVGR